MFLMALFANKYYIDKVSTSIAKQYVFQHHYAKGMIVSAFPCYGLFQAESLIGLCVFANPISQFCRRAVFGPESWSAVTELHRFHIKDCTESNVESWFLAKCLKKLCIDKPEIRAVISFSDPKQGHKGVIYQALSAIYYGRTARRLHFFDPLSGQLRHSRVGGKRNADGSYEKGYCLKKQDGIDKGWIPEMREPKHRYVFLIGNKTQKKIAKTQLKLTSFPYPK